MSDSRLQMSLRVRVAFGLAVVYLMVAKPEAADAGDPGAPKLGELTVRRRGSGVL